jgi:hypothetical protein
MAPYRIRPYMEKQPGRCVPGDTLDPASTWAEAAGTEEAATAASPGVALVKKDRRFSI